MTNADQGKFMPPTDVEPSLGIPGLLVTPLKRIAVPGGDVLHGLRCNESAFRGFGEAYFSFVNPGAIKAWKRHREMTLNLVVPVGAIRFVIHDNRQSAANPGAFFEIVLSADNYRRLTVPPMLWFGFQGIGGSSGLLLNVASIVHDPAEVDRAEIDNFAFNWSVVP